MSNGLSQKIYITDASVFRDPEKYRLGFSLLNEQEKEKILRYKRIEDRARSLCGILLVRFAYGCYKYKNFMTVASENFSFISDVNPSFFPETLILCDFQPCDSAAGIPSVTLLSWGDTDFEGRNEGIFPGLEEGEDGKPFIKGEKSFYFNISHSGDLCGIMISENECGFDLQEFRQISPSLFKWFFKMKDEKPKDEIPSGSNREGIDADMPDISLNIRQRHGFQIPAFLKDDMDVIENRLSVEGNSFIYEDISREDILLFLHWSAAESYVKLGGMGLRADVRRVLYSLRDGYIRDLGPCMENEGNEGNAGNEGNEVNEVTEGSEGCEGKEPLAVCRSFILKYRDKYYFAAASTYKNEG